MKTKEAQELLLSGVNKTMLKYKSFYRSSKITVNLKKKNCVLNFIVPNGSSSMLIEKISRNRSRIESYINNEQLVIKDLEKLYKQAKTKQSENFRKGKK